VHTIEEIAQRHTSHTIYTMVMTEYPSLQSEIFGIVRMQLFIVEWPSCQSTNSINTLKDYYKDIKYKINFFKTPHPVLEMVTLYHQMMQFSSVQCLHQCEPLRSH